MTKEEIIRKYKRYLFPSVSTYFSEPLVTEHAWPLWSRAATPPPHVRCSAGVSPAVRAASGRQLGA
jgi:hypothetical protein